MPKLSPLSCTPLVVWNHQLLTIVAIFCSFIKVVERYGWWKQSDTTYGISKTWLWIVGQATNLIHQISEASAVVSNRSSLNLTSAMAIRYVSMSQALTAKDEDIGQVPADREIFSTENSMDIIFLKSWIDRLINVYKGKWNVFLVNCSSLRLQLPFLLVIWWGGNILK